MLLALLAWLPMLLALLLALLARLLALLASDWPARASGVCTINV
jgi:hypothetical protein